MSIANVQEERHPARDWQPAYDVTGAVEQDGMARRRVSLHLFLPPAKLGELGIESGGLVIQETNGLSLRFNELVFLCVAPKRGIRVSVPSSVEPLEFTPLPRALGAEAVSFDTDDIHVAERAVLFFADT